MRFRQSTFESQSALGVHIDRNLLTTPLQCTFSFDLWFPQHSLRNYFQEDILFWKNMLFNYFGGYFKILIWHFSIIENLCLASNLKQLFLSTHATSTSHLGVVFKLAEQVGAFRTFRPSRIVKYAPGANNICEMLPF